MSTSGDPDKGETWPCIVVVLYLLGINCSWSSTARSVAMLDAALSPRDG